MNNDPNALATEPVSLILSDTGYVCKNRGYMSCLKVNNIYRTRIRVYTKSTGVHAAVTLSCQHTLNKYHLCKIDDSS